MTSDDGTKFIWSLMQAKTAIKEDYYMASQSLNTLHDLFIVGLKEAYGAEKQILQAIPMMVNAASSQDLKNVFQQHVKSTQEQISRLEDIFEMLDVDPEEMPCSAISGLIEDGRRIMSMSGNPKVKDAALIAAEQKGEHFEIAIYGTLRTWAQEMGHDDVAEQLQMTLREESQADKMLSNMATSDVNVSAPQM